MDAYEALRQSDCCFTKRLYCYSNTPNPKHTRFIRARSNEVASTTYSSSSTRMIPGMNEPLSPPPSPPPHNTAHMDAWMHGFSLGIRRLLLYETIGLTCIAIQTLKSQNTHQQTHSYTTTTTTTTAAAAVAAAAATAATTTAAEAAAAPAPSAAVFLKQQQQQTAAATQQQQNK